MSDQPRHPDRRTGDGSTGRTSPNLGPKDGPTRRRPSTRRPGDRPKRGGGRIWLRVLVWCFVLVLVAASGWLWWNNNFGPDDHLSFDDISVPVPEAEPVAGDRAVVLVFPEWDASGFVTEERQIPSRDRPGEDLLGLMQVLCEGPRISGAISALPQGTRAVSAFYNRADAAVILEFSQELVIGHPGGSAAEAATLTSILRTVALNFPQAHSCVILVDGAQVETLAGHLFLDQTFDPRRWL